MHTCRTCQLSVVARTQEHDASDNLRVEVGVCVMRGRTAEGGEGGGESDARETATRRADGRQARRSSHHRGRADPDAVEPAVVVPGCAVGAMAPRHFHRVAVCKRRGLCCCRRDSHRANRRRRHRGRRRRRISAHTADAQRGSRRRRTAGLARSIRGRTNGLRESSGRAARGTKQVSVMCVCVRERGREGGREGGSTRASKLSGKRRRTCSGLDTHLTLISSPSSSVYRSDSAADPPACAVPSAVPTAASRRCSSSSGPASSAAP